MNDINKDKGSKDQDSPTPKREPEARKLALQDVINKTGLTRNQLINLFTDIDLSEIAFKNESLSNKAYKAQRATFLNRKGALQEAVEWKELLLRDMEADKTIRGVTEHEKDISKQMFEKLWPLIVPKIDNSGNVHLVIKYLEKKKPEVEQALGLITPTAKSISYKK